MYDYIKGQFVSKISTQKGCYAVVETGGIGYNFEILQRDFDCLPEVEKEIKMYSILLHREDKMSLCGFLKREDRDIFNILTSVSGVGSKMALTLLNSFKVPDFVGFVIDGDFKSITKAKGVGPKLAQKIVLELKDKLISFGAELPQKTSQRTSASNNSINVEDARMVLLSLGYEKLEAEDAISTSVKSLSQNATAEEILKKSLQLLSV